MTTPQSPQAKQAAEQLARMIYMDYLYTVDDRDNPSHPHRGCFTGLIAKYGLNYTQEGQ